MNMTDNTITINFTGSIQELTELLEKHSLSGFRFSAQVNVDLNDNVETDTMRLTRLVDELKRCPTGIAAIKLYRDLTHCSLKEAKDFVIANCHESFPNLY